MPDYELTLADVLNDVIADLTTGTSGAGVTLRDLADEQIKLTGIADTIETVALSQFPTVWAAIAASISTKLQAVKLPAESA